MSGREGRDVKQLLFLFVSQSVRLARLATLEKMESVLLSSQAVDGYVSVCECLLALAGLPAVSKIAGDVLFPRSSSLAKRTVLLWTFVCFLPTEAISSAKSVVDSCMACRVAGLWSEPSSLTSLSFPSPNLSFLPPSTAATN